MKNDQKFNRALDIYRHESHNRYNIGTYKEKSLHRIIKYYIEPDPAFHEIKTGGYIADIRRGNEIFEIQTRDLYRLKSKLEEFLPNYSVTVIFPLICEKYISWIDPQSYEISKKRKSPKKETIYHAMQELYGLKRFLGDENLHFKFLFFTAEEFKYLDGYSKNKKKGASRYERIPTALCDEMDFYERADFARIIPSSLPPEFTVKDFAAAAGTGHQAAARTVNILRELLILRVCGKSGRCFLYQISDEFL